MPASCRRAAADWCPPPATASHAHFRCYLSQTVRVTLKFSRQNRGSRRKIQKNIMVLTHFSSQRGPWPTTVWGCALEPSLEAVRSVCGLCGWSARAHFCCYLQYLVRVTLKFSRRNSRSRKKIQKNIMVLTHFSSQRGPWPTTVWGRVLESYISGHTGIL